MVISGPARVHQLQAAQQAELLAEQLQEQQAAQVLLPDLPAATVRLLADLVLQLVQRLPLLSTQLPWISSQVAE